MSSFLDRVLSQKREEVAEKRRIRRVNELECLASERPPRNFREAISGGGGIIAEIKGKSPTVAEFLQNGDVERLARIYEANGASAISIVTDEANFKTSLRDVDRVRKISTLPILVKDFIIDSHQVLEARAAGADAVLLIARILSANQLASLLALAERTGMSGLVECHDEEDVEKAADAGASIVGINNRDLGTLEVSLDTTRRLIPRIPEGTVCVSESGIHRREEIESLRSLGVDAFLIGGALLSSDEPGHVLRILLGRDDGFDGGSTR
jgi:indole-3-glycerol phosphate synthase